MKNYAFMMVGLLLVAGTASADEIRGTVSNFDSSTGMMTVRKDDGQEVQVKMNQDAKYSGTGTSAADVQSGSMVMLDANEDNGAFTASSVELSAAADASDASTTATSSDATSVDASAISGTTASADSGMSATGSADAGSMGASTSGDASATGSAGTGSTSASGSTGSSM